jgi:hypothetical protein
MKSKKPIHLNPKHKGALHKELGVNLDKPIPEKKILGAMKFGTPLEKERANFANNAKKWNHKK